MHASTRARPKKTSINRLSSSFRKGRETTIMTEEESGALVPHKGALCRIETLAGESTATEPSYVIEITFEDDENGVQSHEFVFSDHDFEFASRLFAILDTESTSLVHRATVKEFVSSRCPVFWRRDEDLNRLRNVFDDNFSSSDSPTFDEIWTSVLNCSKVKMDPTDECCCLGVEGWMVFCRFIALAQYLEAKRRFSARHLQQTMRHRNAPRGSEVVVVDVPPPEPPAPLTPAQLAAYERSNPHLPSPELDLDHSLLAAHDLSPTRRRLPRVNQMGSVKISIFGSTKSPVLSSTTPSSKDLEFAVTYLRQSSQDSGQEVIVRRSMADMKWLDDTFTSHKVLGGTLCGRILPPFPSSKAHSGDDSASSAVLSTASSIKQSTGGAIQAAAVGVGRIRDVAKTWIGSLTSIQGPVPEGEEAQTPARSSQPSQPKSSRKAPRKKSAYSLALPDNYYNPNSPVGKARRLERYLNYLLEHPALSTSFPLHTILTASQSGLEAARQCLDECSRASMARREETPQLHDGKTGVTFWPPSSSAPHFPWVRTAAQAAVALQVHGMLETSGLPSASARLQHASLPSFGPSARRAGWDEGEVDARGREASAGGVDDDGSSVRESNNFEEGVVNDEGYDLLPLPVPAPERRILNAGSDVQPADASVEERFHYGNGALQGQYPPEEEDDARPAYLGDIAIDNNIDKLREVIGSVENTLSRCLASSGRIGKAQRERQNLHLGVVRGLDSWAGMRGRFVSQRSLMKGVAGIDQSREIYEEGDLTMIDDISWQSSLAASAVGAAEDVRAAVRASRTAANARAAASSAAMSAQAACEKGEFANIDEARAAQTRASIAQSHAIHAAVVEHEAKTVKRRATLALAHDVKTWNVHRKREMLRSCMAYTRSQHEAVRRAVDAWSSLRDGFVGASVTPATLERRIASPAPAPVADHDFAPNSDIAITQLDSSDRLRRPVVVDPDEATAMIYENTSATDSSGDEPAIVAVEHDLLNAAPGDTIVPADPETSKSDDPDPRNLPLADAALIPEDFGDLMSFSQPSSFHGTSHDVSSSEEPMSASMQSLVEGLMSWGGGFDVEEDHLALPQGMATSILFEQRGNLGDSRSS